MLVSCKGNDLLSFLENNTWFSVSTVAHKALSKVLDKRNGVDPGTTATFNCKP